MAEPKSFKVGSAPWETGEAPKSFKAGQAPWEIDQSKPGEENQAGFVDTVVKVGKAIDSYTGAPVRSVVGAVQDGKNPFSAYAEQFGEDPAKAPTGQQIVQKAGMSDDLLPEIPKSMKGFLSALPGVGPAAEAYNFALAKRPKSEVAGGVVDLVADPTNLIPVVGPAKRAIGATEMGAKAFAKGEQVLSKTGQAISNTAKEGGKRAVSILLGPDMDSINRYLSSPDGIRGAKSVEQIKDSIDATMQGLFDGVEKAKLSKDEAKEALSMVESKIRDTVRESNFQFRVDQADIKDSLRAAQSRLNEVYKSTVDELSNIKSPIHHADDVQASIADLKSQVSSASKQSYDILGKSNVNVNVAPIFQDLVALTDSLKPGGVGPLTDSGMAAFSKIEALKNRVGMLPAGINGPQAKQFIQELDQAIDYGARTGEFTSDVSNALRQIRRGFDSQLKSVPEYAAKMQEVAEKTKLLSQATDRFGDSRASVSRLNQIAGRTAGEDRAILENLGGATGRDFKAPIENFQAAQNKLKDPGQMESLKRGLPEYREVTKQEFRARQGARPEAASEYSQRALQREGLDVSRVNATDQLSSATKSLDEAQSTLEPFKRVTPTNSENMVRGLMKAPGKENIEIRRTLEDLSKKTDKDFMGWIADRRAADQFAGEFRMGSRNVNLWTILGGLGGGLPGAGAGVAMGAIVDRFGPTVARKILDGALKIEGSPTLAKIKELKLEPRAEAFLINQATRLRSLSEDTRAVAEDKEPVKLKGREKWASDGFNKLFDGSSVEMKEKLMTDPKMKELLIRASDLKPGSKAMEKIKDRISEAYGAPTP